MLTPESLDEIEARPDSVVQDASDTGIFCARHDMITDEDLFELAMKHNSRRQSDLPGP